MSPNDRLRQLVDASGLPPAVALTVFNRGLGAAACAASEWDAFFVAPEHPRFEALTEAQLAHAEVQFGRIGVRA